MKLYGNPFSPRSRRVAIGLAELQLPVELVALDIGKGENRNADYLSRNPMGKIPTFEADDGWLLWESCAILAYLGEQHADKGLYPKEPRAKAEALKWMFWCTSHVDPYVSEVYVQKFLAPLRKQPTDEAAVDRAWKELTRYLAVLDHHLSGPPYLLGAKFSLVDVVIGIAVETLLMPQLGRDFAPYPNLMKWVTALRARPSWSAFRG